MEFLLTLSRESIQVQVTILTLPSWAISMNFIIFTIPSLSDMSISRKRVVKGLKPAAVR